MLVHGALDDGTTHWLPSVPFLADRFTCYVMSLRNRGDSGTSADVSSQREIEDVVAVASVTSWSVDRVGSGDAAADVWQD